MTKLNLFTDNVCVSLKKKKTHKDKTVFWFGLKTLVTAQHDLGPLSHFFKIKI